MRRTKARSCIWPLALSAIMLTPCLAAPAQATCPTGQFPYTTPYEVLWVGGGSSSVNVVDIDADGDLDIFVANNSNQSISLLRQESLCSFERIDLPVPDRPRDIAVFDMNGDSLGHNPCTSTQQFDTGSSEFSGIYDPRLPDIVFPFKIVLGPAKAMFILGHLFVEGDEIDFEYNSISKELTARGLTIRSYRVISPEPSLPIRTLWRRHLIEKVSALGANPSDAALQSALDSMDHSLLDSTYTPTISRRSVIVKFRGDTWREHIMFPSDSHRPFVPMANAKEALSALLKPLQQVPTPFIFVRVEGGDIWLTGRQATEMTTLLRAALQRSLSASERQQVLDLGVDVVEIEYLISAARSEHK